MADIVILGGLVLLAICLVAVYLLENSMKDDMDDTEVRSFANEPNIEEIWTVYDEQKMNEWFKDEPEYTMEHFQNNLQQESSAEA